MARAFPEALEIRLGDVLVGYLSHYPDGRNEFVFDRSYIDLGPSRPILSLFFTVPGDEAGTRRKLERSYTSSMKLMPFFSNLLPEKVLRDYVARRLGIHQDHEFQMLSALGHNLPGAVIARPAGDVPAHVRESRPSLKIEPQTEPPLAFSLGGAQLKFSMARRGGRFVSTLGGGEEWIVKPPHPNYSDVPVNEYAMMKLAAAIGLEVPEVKLVPLQDLDLPDQAGLTFPHGEPYAYAIKRYDRSVAGRIHAEDFAQVYGVYTIDAYSIASYDVLGRTILGVASGGISDLETFIRQLTFTLLIGNGDAHLKNWSLIYPDRVRPRPSPLYDQLCTVALIPSERLALSFGKEKDFYRLGRHHFERFATKANIAPKFVLRIVRETVERANDLWPEVLSELPLSQSLNERLKAHWNQLDSLFRVPSGLVQHTFPVPGAPRDITFDPAGNAWIADQGNNRVVKLSTAGEVLGTYRAGKGPTGIAADSTGHVWVVNGGRDGSIMRYSPTGDGLDEFILSGSGYVGAGDFFWSVAIDAQDCPWITVISAGRVAKLAPDGQVLDFYNASGGHPRNLAFDAQGNAWVTTETSHSVTRLTTDGKLAGTIRVGNSPWAIAVDGQGNIWVTNQGSHNVTKLSPSGEVLGTFGVGQGPMGIVADGAGHIWVANEKDNTVTQLAPDGTVAAVFPVPAGPTAVAIDPAGSLWITSARNGSVTKLAPEKSGPFVAAVAPRRISPRGHTSRSVSPFERKVLDLARTSPREAADLMAQAIERALGYLAAAMGITNEHPQLTSEEALEIFQQRGELLRETRALYSNFHDIRTQLGQGEMPAWYETLRGIDSGLTALRTIRSIPHEKHFVYQTGIPLYEDAACKRKRSGVWGVMLENHSFSGALTSTNIFPTSRPDYRKGQQVSWESDVDKIWPESWYRDPDNDEIRHAWSSAMEYIGRELDPDTGLELASPMPGPK